MRSKADELDRPRKRRRVMVRPDSNKSCGFENLTEDLLMEILVKLSAKEMTRSMCVSQLWYNVISSRYFTNLFLESPSSSKPPRLLLSLVDHEDQRKYAFLSTSSSSSPQHDQSASVIDQDLDMPGLRGYFVNALRGLLCVRLGRKLRICNLTTKQRVTLPIITSTLLAEPNNDNNIWSFFGHESVYDEYKVLSIVWDVSKEDGIVRCEHQVLVLGPGASWRSPYTTSTIPPHRPFSQGISINGVLYYGAWTDANRCVVVSFDLISEEFSLIELPIKAGIVWHTYRSNIVNYQGKLAVFDYSQLASNATVDLWVMEDEGKMNWSNKTLVFPLSSINFVQGERLGILGTGRCSEIRLAKTNLLSFQPRPFVIYDLNRNQITRSFEISRPPYLCFLGINKGFQTNFWEDDIESILYLET
ncbi:PREDICTED: putative F-box protein At3g52320 [Camelina sativa]|uniref:F-box protein At3g52320 n=1 Tax=Camelina sativa TaxID=90675 RepID=A0ABM0YPG1_CAMSA|nr:PREDICTED: putative F-box protein At3g52320 [Camelina sativa]